MQLIIFKLVINNNSSYNYDEMLLRKWKAIWIF